MLKNCQKGSSMVDVIAALGVISVVAVGIFVTVYKIFDRYHQTAIVTQIRDLQKNIQQRYATASDYRDLTEDDIVQTLIDERVIPYGMVSGGRIYNAYNGNVTLSGTQYDYTITFSDIKKAGCVDLLAMSWTVNNTSDLVKLEVGGKTYTWTGENTDLQLPVPLVDAGALCKDAQNQNTIKWTFQ